MTILETTNSYPSNCPKIGRKIFHTMEKDRKSGYFHSQNNGFTLAETKDGQI